MNNVEEIKVGLDGSYMNFIRVDGGEKPLVVIAGVSLSGIPALEALATEENCTQLAALLRAAESFDMYDRLNEIRCPVLVLADKNDAVIPVECAYELREKLGCESVIYDRYSHAVYDEAPELKTAVAKFLRK